MAITLLEQRMTATHAPTKNGHTYDTTTTNCLGGNNYWPKSNRINPSNQDHISCKGKSAPN